MQTAVGATHPDCGDLALASSSARALLGRVLHSYLSLIRSVDAAADYAHMRRSTCCEYKRRRNARERQQQGTCQALTHGTPAAMRVAACDAPCKCCHRRTMRSDSRWQGSRCRRRLRRTHRTCPAGRTARTIMGQNCAVRSRYTSHTLAADHASGSLAALWVSSSDGRDGSSCLRCAASSRGKLEPITSAR